MNSSPQSDSTRLFARVLGPYLVIIMAVAVIRLPDYQELLSAFDSSPLLAWVTGAFTLLSGLVVVALHQRWSGAAAIIVTVLGWLTTLKGAVIMAVPGVYSSKADIIVNGSELFVAGAVVVGLAGLYLTYVGWGPRDS